MTDGDVLRHLDQLRDSAVAFARDAAIANPPRAREVFAWLADWCGDLDRLADMVLRRDEPHIDTTHCGVPRCTCEGTHAA